MFRFVISFLVVYCTSHYGVICQKSSKSVKESSDEIAKLKTFLEAKKIDLTNVETNLQEVLESSDPEMEFVRCLEQQKRSLQFTIKALQDRINGNAAHTESNLTERMIEYETRKKARLDALAQGRLRYWNNTQEKRRQQREARLVRLELAKKRKVDELLKKIEGRKKLTEIRRKERMNRTLHWAEVENNRRRPVMRLWAKLKTRMPK